MWIAVVCFLFIFILLIYLDTRRPHNYPPGPKWLPIIGNAHLIRKLRKQTGSLPDACELLAEQYGPILGLKIGNERQVIVRGIKEQKEFLHNEDLAGRPTNAFFVNRTMGMARGIIMATEDTWQEQRRFVLKNLREFGYGKGSMSTMLEEEMQEMVSRFKGMLEKSKTPLVLKMNDAFGIHVINNLWMMMAGIRYNNDDQEVLHLLKILRELFNHIDMTGAYFSYFPILKYIAPESSGYKIYMQTHIPLWKFLRAEIENHKKTFDPNHPRDLIDMYLIMMNSPDKPASFDDMQLLSICLDLFEAGSETTNNSLIFGIMYMLLHPDIQKKAQEEIDREIGRDRAARLSDRPRMPYLESITLESIRMMMGRGFGIPHQALRDTKLCGYDIPKGTMVVASTTAVLRGSASSWSDPEVFRPERHIIDGKIVLAESFLAFGSGRRRCLGESLAKSSLFLFLASLLQNFNFTIPKGGEPPSTEAIDGVTATPKPFYAEISPRY